MKAKVKETGEIVEVYHEPQHGQITNIYKESVFLNGRIWTEDELEFFESKEVNLDKEVANKLIELRNYFIQRTDYFSERAKIITASPQGSHMDKGVANGYIGARSKLEELFDYLNLWE